MQVYGADEVWHLAGLVWRGGRRVGAGLMATLRACRINVHQTVNLLDLP